MKKWKFSDIGAVVKDYGLAILQGQFLLRMKAHEFFLQILYTFVLFALIILISYETEATMAEVEKNKATLQELEIGHSQRVFEVAELERRSVVKSNLSKLGSSVGEPTKPATTISKRGGSK